MKSLFVKNNKEEEEKSGIVLEKMYYMFIMLLTLTFGFDVYTQLGEYHVYSDKNKFDFYLKNCVLLMMIISSIVYSSLIRRIIITDKAKISNQECVNKTLMEVNEELKCFKHDFYNIIQAINGYLYLNDLIRIKKVL